MSRITRAISNQSRKEFIVKAFHRNLHKTAAFTGIVCAALLVASTAEAATRGIGAATPAAVIPAPTTSPKVGRVINRLPIGNVDVISGPGGVVTIVGWALDPDTPNTPLIVRVGPLLSGNFGGFTYEGPRLTDDKITANLYRADVASTYGTAGLHGFSYSFKLSPGTYRLGIYAADSSANTTGSTFNVYDYTQFIREITVAPY
jgi:hypothetical protein